MTDEQTIYLLRAALACIWTELEKDVPSEEDCRGIADEALELTAGHAKPKVLGRMYDEKGLEAWRLCLADRGLRARGGGG